MKGIIEEVNRKSKSFYIIVGNIKTSFYLPNKLSKTFLCYLEKGVLVDFEVGNREKLFGRVKMREVLYFRKIIKLKNKHTYYDLESLQKDMMTVLSKYDKMMFLDFEMTMPEYGSRCRFLSEIIQVGYIVSDKDGKTILEDEYYVLPKEKSSINKRTKKFLTLDEELYFSKAIPYQEFYERLKNIVKEYNPKIVVWGKNDLIALEDSYKLHKKESITNSKNFVDLLKLHKDYFNLKNDLGLFKAYQTYYDETDIQSHDAKEDAMITKDVFEAFLRQVK